VINKIYINYQIIFFLDKCLGNGVKSYGDKSSCRSYWTCQGYSTPMCCPKGSRFISNVGCVPDNTCLDDCLLENVVTNSGIVLYEKTSPYMYRGFGL
jgi:hypothetical protein